VTDIYVIAHDGGYEGYSGPMQASASREEAFRLAHLMSAGGSFRVFKVPVWPEAQRVEWFRVKPEEEGEA
jgi:hypothetical protein